MKKEISPMVATVLIGLVVAVGSVPFFFSWKADRLAHQKPTLVDGGLPPAEYYERSKKMAEGQASYMPVQSMGKALQYGQNAPNVRLMELSGTEIHLSEKVGVDKKPLVLIFGSFT